MMLQREIQQKRFKKGTVKQFFPNSDPIQSRKCYRLLIQKFIKFNL